ncbi:glycosyltransferase family 2 protein [Pelosinus sp. sgz500959]|uniref:glycosyltransferase family 2 protein n=1 Tax=Pelosinus sp. sgz500959 TaxID=3242472 RepID=UPI00366C24A4
MSENPLTTPIVLIIFNRPTVTQQVFNEIRRARPTKLLVIADGPRPDMKDDVQKCTAVRNIIDQVDWECQVLRNYSDVNLGCKRRVASGLDWVFGMVEEAIILEDDCLPHPTFFPFCQELLKRYRDDQRIMTISGNNFQYGQRRSSYSYYFSRYAHVWGWATWRRAWKYYQVDMSLWPEVRTGQWLFDILGSMRANIKSGQCHFDVMGSMKAIEYWYKIFDYTYAGKIDTWDYQLIFASWLQNGLHILPNINLVSNIGFGADATHTKVAGKCTNIPAEAVVFPLQHPTFMVRDAAADDYTQVTHY